MRSANLQETERLLGGYLDGTLEDGETEKFRQLLVEHSECLELFCEHVLTEADLRKLGEVGSAMNGMGLKGNMERRERRLFSKSILTAAAIILAMGIVMVMILAPGPEPMATIRTSPHSVISLSNPSGDPVESSGLKEGDTVRLSQGVAEIKLAVGVTCHLQAPASLTLLEPGLVSMSGGLARFEVEERAVGFRVRTQGLEVRDLGTVFGVNDEMPLETQVHVMEGKVEVQSVSGRKEFQTLGAGEAVALGAAGSLLRIPSEEQRFVSELPSGIPSVYFSFDKSEGRVVKAEGSLAHRDSVQFAVDGDDALVSGRRGSAMRISGRKERIVTNWKGIGETQARTIALWMRAGSPPGEVLGGSYLLCYGLDWGGHSMSQVIVRLGRNPDSRPICFGSGGRWLEGTTSLDDGEWHHLVFVIGEYVRGEWPVIRLYVDGEQEELTPREHDRAASLDSFGTRIRHPRSKKLTFGSFNNQPSFVGDLDEVVIAAGILSPTQVKALYEGRLEESGLDLSQ